MILTTMSLTNTFLFLRKKIIFLCVIGFTAYFVSMFFFLHTSQSFNALKVISPQSITIYNINSSQRLVQTSSKTSMSKSVVNFINSNKMGLKNVTIEKYDAMKVYEKIMKRRIARIMARLPQDIVTELPTQNINDSVHIFFTDILTSVISKNKLKYPMKNTTHDIIEENFKIAQQAGAGVIILSCSRLSESLISQTSKVHHYLRRLFYLAPKYGIKISIAIKDYIKRNVMSIRKDIRIFMSHYGDEQSLYRIKKTDSNIMLPVIYIMSSFTLSSVDWNQILFINGKYTIRDTKLDAIILGEMRDEDHSAHIRLSHFDGFFSSHLKNKESYSSTWKNWQSISKWAYTKKLLWSAGISESPSGVAALGVALRTILRCDPRPAFVSLTNVPPMDQYLHLTQAWLKKWENSSITDI